MKYENNNIQIPGSDIHTTNKLCEAITIFIQMFTININHKTQHNTRNLPITVKHKIGAMAHSLTGYLLGIITRVTFRSALAAAFLLTFNRALCVDVVCRVWSW
jgi:hypothetical protein